MHHQFERQCGSTTEIISKERAKREFPLFSPEKFRLRHLGGVVASGARATVTDLATLVLTKIINIPIISLLHLRTRLS
jgi:hypothetical protein